MRVRVCVYGMGKNEVSEGDRIAQLIIEKIETPDVVEVDVSVLATSAFWECLMLTKGTAVSPFFHIGCTGSGGDTAGRGWIWINGRTYGARGSIIKSSYIRSDDDVGMVVKFTVWMKERGLGSEYRNRNAACLPRGSYIYGTYPDPELRPIQELDAPQSPSKPFKVPRLPFPIPPAPRPRHTQPTRHLWL